jgi:hypothetical protein
MRERYLAGDIVSFRFTTSNKRFYNGIIVASWKKNNRVMYEIASMNHSMVSYTIADFCIDKKIA